MSQASMSGNVVGAGLKQTAVLVGLLVASLFAQPGWAQVPVPPTFFENYFVTGDYVVGGWVEQPGTTTLINGAPYTLGTISIPDSLQALYLDKSIPTAVPAGAEIVAAFLYWQTVEGNQSPLAGQQAYFNGYSITGATLGNKNAPVSWSAGGCNGSSQGSKTMRTYRADVRPYLNLDANAKITGNGTYNVYLADSGSNGNAQPNALGATLVIIYRVLAANAPLNAIVLYDGSYAPSNAVSTFSDMITGFYQPATASPFAKITHIVGNGQPNKLESAYYSSLNLLAQPNQQLLPSLYKQLYGPTAPPFPGLYGSWDNPTWIIGVSGGGSGTDGSFDQMGTTTVLPSSSNAGCISWGAIILSTTVQDTDGDGLLDTWEQKQGYVSIKRSPASATATTNTWVALPGADPYVKDIFVEVDYLSNLDGKDGTADPYVHTHLPKQAALDMVGGAFAAKNVNVHFDLGPNSNGTTVYANDPYLVTYPYTLPTSAPPGVSTYAGAGGTSISEGQFFCSDTSTSFCAFPGQPAIGWKGGFLYVKNATNLGNFQPDRKDTYHYVLFGHALGGPRSYWSAVGEAPNVQPAALQANNGLATLVSISVNNNVGTVTLLTPQPPLNTPGLIKPGDAACTDVNCDRVTIEGALLNTALNATYKFKTKPSSTTDPVTGMIQTTFKITTSGVANGTYAYSSTTCSVPYTCSEPQLGLTYGGPTSASGHSDIGGGDTAVTFGLWPADDAGSCSADPTMASPPSVPYCDNQVGNVKAQAGTLMHELGHTFTLTHGGTFYPNGAVATSGDNAGQQLNTPLGLASYGFNCNPGFLSAMNYLFQIRGFPDGGQPLTPRAIDYSGQTLTPVDETNLNENNGIGLDFYLDIYYTGPLAAHWTRWYAPPNSLDNLLQDFSTLHCDGTPIPIDPVTNQPVHMVRVNGNSFSYPIDWDNDLAPLENDTNISQDVNFNGITGDALQGFNDWVNLDLRQIGARWNVFGFSGGGITGAAGGGITGAAGGGITGAAGGGITGAAGGGSLADPGSGITGAAGGGITGAAGGGITGAAGGGEQDSDIANSVADAPQNLTCMIPQGGFPACVSSTDGFVEHGKAVPLTWTAPEFGQVRKYVVWRALGRVSVANSNLFSKINTFTSNNGPPQSNYVDTNVKNKTTYTYFVSDANAKGVPSGASNAIVVTLSF